MNTVNQKFKQIKENIGEFEKQSSTDFTNLKNEHELFRKEHLNKAKEDLNQIQKSLKEIKETENQIINKQGVDKEFLDGNIKTLNAELNKVQTEQDRLGKKSKLFIQEITSLTQSNIKDIEKKWKELHRGGLKGLDIILKEKSNDIKTHIQKIKEKGEQKIEDKLNKKILSIEKQTAKEIQDFHHQIANSFDSLNALNLEQSTLLNDSKNIKKTVEESNKELKLFEQQIKIKLEKEFEESIKKINNQWAEELHREISISKAEISKKIL